MSRTWGARWLIVVLAAVVWMSACTPGGPALPAAGAQETVAPAVFSPTSTKLVIGLGALSPQNANLQATLDAGIFLKHGLDVELQYTGGGANSIAPLVSGEIPVMVGGIPAFVLAQLGGADLAIIAVQSNRFDYYFVANPEIKQPEDLRGKTVSGTRRGALADTAIDYLLRYWGLVPYQDVFIAEVNAGESVRAAALANGAAVGTVMIAPLAREFAEGPYNILANMSELNIPFASNGLAALRSRLAQSPDVYERLLRAYIEGNQFYRTHPEEGARSVLKLLKRDDLEYGRAAHAYYARLIPAVPLPAPGAIEAVLEALADAHPQARSMQPEALLDLRLIERIVASGFVDQLRRN